MLFPLELLESRLLLSAVDPTVYEQYMLHLVNRARNDPVAEAQRYGITLNEGVPAEDRIARTSKPPLAMNTFLNSSADSHTQWMLAADVFSHTGLNGSNPFDRDIAAGYEFVAPHAWGENLAYVGQQETLPEVMESIERLHRNLFVDDGYEGRGHRVSMLADFFAETGVGISDGLFGGALNEASVWMMAQEFASTAGDAFITGVVFADTMSRDGLFDPYEGLGGVTVEARATDGNAVYRTKTWDAGGYSLQVPAGEYVLSASGGDLPTPIVLGSGEVGEENVLGDFDASDLAEIPVLTESGVVRVLGGRGDDVISIADLGERIRVYVNSASYDFTRSAVTAFEIHASAGNDSIKIAPYLPMAGIYGDEGNDTILGGSSTDYIFGGAGDDVINGRFGSDYVSGDDGRDFLEGRAGNDTILGGKGRDSIFGGNHDDSVMGGNAADYVDGGTGNDVVAGNANRDTLLGGSGNDYFAADDGEVDWLDGGEGSDRGTVDPLLDVMVNLEL